MVYHLHFTRVKLKLVFYCGTSDTYSDLFCFANITWAFSVEPVLFQSVPVKPIYCHMFEAQFVCVLYLSVTYDFSHV